MLASGGIWLSIVGVNRHEEISNHVGSTIVQIIESFQRSSKVSGTMAGLSPPLWQYCI